MTQTHTTTRQPLAGFSLAELLIVIAIISIIAALLLAGVAKLQGGAKESQAQTLLTNLMGNAGQYETKTTKPVEHELSSTISWGGPRQKNALAVQGQSGVIQARYDNIDNNGDFTYANDDTNDEYMRQANRYIERFIWAANQVPEIRKNLPSLGGAFADLDDDGFMEVVDPWGNPIAYAARVNRRPGANVEFLPIHDNPFFASAGADQMWGRPKHSGEFNSDAAWNAYKETDDYKFSIDNLYSFDLDRSASTR